MARKFLIIGFGLGILVWVIFLMVPFESKFFFRDSTRKVIESLPYYVDARGWKLVLWGNTDGQKSASFEKIDNDTIKHIIFLITEEGDAGGVIRFTKKYEAPGVTYTLKMDSRDTLYSFGKTLSGDTVFQRGEYFFKFTTFQLDTAQQKYFLLYRDSLSAIRGDDLPDLPNLEADEHEEFNATMDQEK